MIQLIKINTESELEIKEMKEKMDEVKVTITTATKGMRESLDKAETNIANLIKEVSMLATASPQEQKQILDKRLFPLVQMIQNRPNIAGKITGIILEMHNSSNIELGVGLDFRQLCLVIQELLARLKKLNPDRYSPPTWVDFYPEETFARRLAARNGISLRRTMSLSTARACLTVSDLDSWFSNIKERFVDPPEFSEVWKDPQRIFNQDESSPEFGSEHQTVLAPKGHKGPLYNIGGSSRDHVTLSKTFSASGDVAGMRVVYSGKRWSQGEKDMIENLPSAGVTGEWRFFKSEKGYVNRE